ncbi:hypothetical protein PG996_007771 [Apiospora saccharicola]|uniref:NADAR domain-containing protein n=1 Tax=Apiospora saccharicola TaxID=335842 RepID=A0ABR1UW06_9PEZI
MATRQRPGPGAMPRLYFNGKHGEHGYLSHRHEHDFEDNRYPGVVFPTMEHYMHYAKAMLFNDVELANAIMKVPKTATTGIAKKAAKVKNFDQETWDENKVKIAGRGNIKKFTAPGAGDMRRQLLATQGKHLVYACMDKVWGIGMYADIAEYRRHHWGSNLLGKALMAVRNASPKLSWEVRTAQFPASATKQGSNGGKGHTKAGDDTTAGPSNSGVQDKDASDVEENPKPITPQPVADPLPTEPGTTTEPSTSHDADTSSHPSAPAPEPEHDDKEPSNRQSSDLTTTQPEVEATDSVASQAPNAEPEQHHEQPIEVQPSEPQPSEIQSTDTQPSEPIAAEPETKAPETVVPPANGATSVPPTPDITEPMAKTQTEDLASATGTLPSSGPPKTAAATDKKTPRSRKRRNPGTEDSVPKRMATEPRVAGAMPLMNEQGDGLQLVQTSAAEAPGGKSGDALNSALLKEMQEMNQHMKEMKQDLQEIKRLI